MAGELNMRPPRTGQKTYWHLLERRRVPSDYEVVSTRLHYYPQIGFAVDTPVSQWYRRHQPPKLAAAEEFADPLATTYASYVLRKHEQEIHLDRICHGAEPLSPSDEALALWTRVMAPARYPFHGLQMAAAYAGSLAPWGRITVALAFQAADEMQRVHRMAYRLRQMQHACPDLGRDARRLWEEEPHWQGMREVVERLLVTYDWAEGFLVLNLALKPLWEPLMLGHGAALARHLGDTPLAALLACLAEDGNWRRAWTVAALQALIGQGVLDAPALAAPLTRWQPLVRRATERLAQAMDGIGQPKDGAAAMRLECALRDQSALYREVGIETDTEGAHGNGP